MVFCVKFTTLKTSILTTKTLCLVSFSFLLLLPQTGVGQTLKLKIAGTSETQYKTIDSVGYQDSFKNFSELEKEKNNFSQRLINIGYINLVEISFENLGDSLFVSHIDLGTRFRQLKIYYNKDLLSQSLLRQYSKNVADTYFVIPIENSETLLNAISRSYESKGFSFAEVQLKNIETKNGLVIATLNTEINEKRTIDKIVVKGYDNFPQNFIRYYAGIKIGKRVSKDEIIRKAEQLRSLPFASQNKPPELLFTVDSTVVYLYLQKAKSSSFDGFLGFSNDQDTGDFTLNGTIDFRLNNTLNRGETFNLFWKDDGNDQTRFMVDVEIPYLFNAPFGAKLSLSLFRQDSTYVNVDKKFNLTYQLSERVRMAGGIKQYESNNLRDIAINSVQDLDATFFNLDASYEIMQADNLFFPRKLSLAVNTEFGNRKSESVKSAQQRFGFRGLYQYSLNERNKILLRNTSEIILSPNYFENETFRFGGINSIRGFGENILAATTYSVVNTEYQYIASNTLYLHTLTDFAYLENEVTQLRDNLISFGFGLGLLTRAGILRLNYAIGKSKNSEFNFSESKVHVSLNARF
ncbi:MAG: hypothetical protein CO119_06185 [Flavobacteriales bacterium CG_4_9_14_3_um_filter_40_17]|nr:MAG: hypothetical protein CO119_06185 [Flavobacteriales bacterium CG_4_9_14_3_um_filter_40_17]